MDTLLSICAAVGLVSLTIIGVGTAMVVVKWTIEEMGR